MALPSGVRKTHPPSRCPQHGKGFKFDIMVTYGDRMAWVLDSEEAANCEKETVGSVRIRLRACNRLPSFCGFIKQFTTFLSSLSLFSAISKVPQEMLISSCFCHRLPRNWLTLCNAIALARLPVGGHFQATLYCFWQPQEGILQQNQVEVKPKHWQIQPQ